MKSRSAAFLQTFLVLLAGLAAAPSVAAAAPTGATSPAAAASKSPAPGKAARLAGAQDPYLWLENIGGKKAVAWVAKQDARTEKALTDNEDFKALQARFLGIFDSKEKIPYLVKIGDLYYNFWRDENHPRGIWRRTTLAQYRKKSPAWETVIDLDSLSRAEKESWVWGGAKALPPDYVRCLVSLSRGGADAVVVREFDLASKSFVRDGFVVPEAKSEVSWRDRDAIYVAADFGPGSLTRSGYPRIAKLWKRGTPLSAATEIHEAKPEDVGVSAWHDFTPGFERDLVEVYLTAFTSLDFVMRDAKPVRIEKPDDADASLYREWLLLRLRTDWTVAGKTWPAGALLATRLDDFLSGKRRFDILFQPAERKSLDSFSPTRHAILLNELDNVKNRLYVLTYDGSRWTRRPIQGLPDIGSIGASGVDPLRSDDYFLTATGFLTPTGYYLGTAGGGAPQRLKTSPSFFESRGLVASQHEAVSKDGTRVPYFQVSRADLKADGTAPTLLTGYGGFEISMQPYYSGTLGSGWLERGGVFALANIRGGGEFGPKWHQAALRANRPRASEDFIAVAEDLIRRKVTSPEHLGCEGGSNGGLLVGNVLTMRPDLFGAVVCQSPLLDMRRYTRLSAGSSWMEEFGNPDIPEDWAFMHAFSPYQNVKKGAQYPPTLFTSSMRDDRVHPGHARKMVAKMEAQGHDVLYYEQLEGGHASSVDNRQLAYEYALWYEFLRRHLR